MQNSPLTHAGTARLYLAGLALALVLTLLPFGLVAARIWPPQTTLAVIAVAAVVQIVVHLRFFLHLDLKPSSQDKLLALCFAAIVIGIMIGGSIWIMFDLHDRMMGM